MKVIGTIQGSGEQAKDLVIGKDTVYVHTNIKKLETDNNGNKVDDLYSYDETQYDKDEYIKLMADQNLEIQLALVEIYESLGV